VKTVIPCQAGGLELHLSVSGNSVTIESWRKYAHGVLMNGAACVLDPPDVSVLIYALTAALRDMRLAATAEFDPSYAELADTVSPRSDPYLHAS
jgi:hypothetical protein